MNDLYILDDHGEPIPASDVYAWSKFMESDKSRIVSRTKIGTLTVSTVFLGLDHNYGSGPPILWETMVFGSGDNPCTRCSGSREQAEAMHANMIKRMEQSTE